MALPGGIETRIDVRNNPTSSLPRQDLQPREVLVLAGPAIWTNRCLERLRSEGYQARRDEPVWGAIVESEASKLIYVVSIPSGQSASLFIAARASEHGGRVAEYWGRDPGRQHSEQVMGAGNLIVEKRDDPQFDKLIEWIRDPVAEAQRAAQHADFQQTGRRIRFLHDT